MKKMNWINILDALPDLGVPVLVSDGNALAVAERCDVSYRQWECPWNSVQGDAIDGNCATAELVFTPTHWAVLPSHPNK